MKAFVFDTDEFQRSITRRSFLQRSAYGLGGIALAALCQRTASRAASGTEGEDSRWRGVVNPPHYPSQAKHVIHLCMAGGPSHVESFDCKPMLKKLDGQPFPASFTQGQQLAQLQNTALKARGPFCGFSKCGQSGQELADIFPHIATIADEICIIRSMHTEQINHD